MPGSRERRSSGLRFEDVSIFEPKQSCPHCGYKVRKPKDPKGFLCPRCGQPGPWATADQVRLFDTRERARARYGELLAQITTTSTALPVNGSELATVRIAAEYTAPELDSVNFAAVRPLVSTAVADDLLTPGESAHLATMLAALGMSWQDVQRSDPELYEHAFVSAINGGQLPEVRSPHILQKKGEIVHFESDATLMKEVAVRQYQGGYSGFSFPLGKTGIRYKVGGSRGHSVQVGTQLQVADSGLLSITNKRAVYSGSAKTVDMPYSKLVNLSVYRDGIQVHLSNRVNAPLFEIRQGSDIIAAIVNMAAQMAEN